MHHYVECHVIVSDDSSGASLPYAQEDGWWGSRLGLDTSGEEKSGDLILTTRRESQECAIDSIRGLANKLRALGYKVTRGKTEIASFDTKRGDDLWPEV